MNSNKYKILVIEDEENIKNLVATLLETSGYKVLDAGDCREGLTMFLSHRPDLVILDLGLPDVDGLVFIEEIRKESTVPVLVLSARANESDKVEALDKGANDYITKPFGSAELLARVRSALRTTRHSAEGGRLPGGKFTHDGLMIDYDSRQVSVDGNLVKLTLTEYNILALLSEHTGKVLTYSFIIKEIWGYNDFGSIKKLQVNMANIRKKLGDKPGKKGYIINELGVGYRI